MFELNTLYVCPASLFKCIKNYCLYKQIKPLHSTGVPKLAPGYDAISRVESNKFDNINNKN